MSVCACLSVCPSPNVEPKPRVRKSGTFCHFSVTLLLPLLLSPTAVWRQSYVFWAQRSTGRCADSTRCTQIRVHTARGKYIVRQWTSREASLRHSSDWGNWSVSLQYRDLRTRGLNQSTDLVQNRYLVSSLKYFEPFFSFPRTPKIKGSWRKKKKLKFS